jgi:hypothetical protein
MDDEVVGQALSTLGKAAAPALIERARELGVALPPSSTTPPWNSPKHSSSKRSETSRGTSFPYWLQADATATEGDVIDRPRVVGRLDEG